MKTLAVDNLGYSGVDFANFDQTFVDLTLTQGVWLVISFHPHDHMLRITSKVNEIVQRIVKIGKWIVEHEWFILIGLTLLFL
jgi:hypothetical protein